jgi:leader peptidase (prepilin peptidase)/N-methyltransferase
VAVPDWIWFFVVFAYGCCIGSFLNVVVYRMPRDKSLVWPPSACPACGEHIRFYDNLPLISWLVLGRKCRYCKASVSARYFVIELLTAVIFLSLFILYFSVDVREGMPAFLLGGWFVYLLHITLLSSFIAASAIDLELWIIPLGICWFVTALAFIASALGACVIDAGVITRYSLLPVASAATGSLAAGATVGLAISGALLVTGLLKRSYESEYSYTDSDAQADDAAGSDGSKEPDEIPEQELNHRQEVFREVVFLLPVIVCSVATYLIVHRVASVETLNGFPTKHPAIAGLLGSVWGYFVGCAVVWAIRIFGTLAFGKEAMGLGDVHLMGAAGAVVGPLMVVVAFFVAPFFGLAWAGSQMFFKKVRQIPYGPFLSLGVLVVMIFHDWIWNRVGLLFSPY